MTLVLRNMQRIIQVNTLRLEKEINILRHCFGVDHFDLSVLCICDDEMATLNSAYRRISLPTDVLALPFYENLQPGEIPPEVWEENVLGEIFLGVNYINEECKKHSIDIHQILPVMVTHGMCNLLGYSQQSEDQWRKMLSKELNILDEFNRRTGGACAPVTAVER